VLSLSSMCKMRNKHLKQLKGKEGTAKKCLLGRRKLNLNKALLVLQKNKKQNLLLYTVQEPQCRNGERREGASTDMGYQPLQSCSGSTRVGSQAQAGADSGNLHGSISSHSHASVCRWWDQSCCQPLNGMGVACSRCSRLLGQPLMPTFRHLACCCTPSVS